MKTFTSITRVTIIATLGFIGLVLLCMDSESILATLLTKVGAAALIYAAVQLTDWWAGDPWLRAYRAWSQKGLEDIE